MLQPLSAQELARIVQNKEAVNILDIRREADVSDWEIQAENVRKWNIPFAQIQEDPAKAKAQLPQDENVYVMCYRGRSAQTAVSLLEQVGMDNTVHITGGMEAWGQTIAPVKIGDLNYGGAIYQFMRIGKGCLSYMIVSDKEAAVVDPARMIDVYTDFAKQHGLTIKHVLDTHLHADHISGGRKLAKKTGAVYWFPEGDGKEADFTFEPLKNNVMIPFGNSDEGMISIASPGHTEGSCSFIIDDTYLLSGDILFMESIGRPDLAGKAEEWVNDLHDTLYTRYPALSLDLIVLPAHFSELHEIGEDGSVQARMADLYERSPRLQMTSLGQFSRSVLESIPAQQPNSYQLIREANQGTAQVPEADEGDIESGPNRCAVGS